MTGKTRLELTWIGKENRPRLEPRILLGHEDFSHHAEVRREGDLFDNVLIKGDNLLALKALESQYRGKVKCAFIDPPYNTGSAFTHYDDGLEHSAWLTLMRERIEAIRALLTEDGSLWIVLDENELHYLKVVCDEIFGRSNFRRHITWQKKYSVSNNFKGIASICDHILVYAKSSAFENNLLPRSAESQQRYQNPDNDPRGPWKAVDYLNQATPKQRPNLCYIIENPNTGEKIGNPRKAWKYDRDTHAAHLNENRLWWGINGRNSTPALKLFLSEVRDGMTPHNWWPHEDVGHTDEAKKESIALFGPENVFDTPKPERLVRRVLDLATNPGDLVLDTFAGSGTTGAVAHKMGRRWIMAELGDHCETHIVPRLTKVVDGEDPGGITEAVGWKGGGGYRYFRLAPSLLEKDQFDNWIISKSYNAEMLSEAMCKHFGFTYAPSADHYWMQGHSSETDFIYVTTASLTHEQLRTISAEVGEGRTLLICCKAFQGDRADDFLNLTMRKIPGAILDRCEWGKDDYSLRIENLPIADDEPQSEPDAAHASKKPDTQTSLFAEDEA